MLVLKGYHDIAGDGGSKVLEQVAEQRARISDGLAGVRHLVAVGSGKGGVGKSTLTLHLAGALRARGLRIAILDADFNGPSQARMAGVQKAVFVPGKHKVALPRTTNGIGVFSMGSLIPESEALDFESVAHGESHTWRATREFALLGEILGAFEWDELDLLIVDLPPGAERTVQYADFLGSFDPDQDRPRTSFLLVTIPSAVARGVVARSVAALSRAARLPLPRKRERLLLPRLQRDRRRSTPRFFGSRHPRSDDSIRSGACPPPRSGDGLFLTERTPVAGAGSDRAASWTPYKEGIMNSSLKPEAQFNLGRIAARCRSPSCPECGWARYDAHQPARSRSCSHWRELD